MAGRKRTSTTELNHDNWDEEEEPEERGQMKVADSNVLESRNIIRATRKLGGNGKGTNQSPFAGLSLFGASPTFQNSAPGLFSSFGFTPATTTVSSFSFSINSPLQNAEDKSKDPVNEQSKQVDDTKDKATVDSSEKSTDDSPLKSYFSPLVNKQDYSKFDQHVVPSFHGLNTYRTTATDSKNVDTGGATSESDQEAEENEDDDKDSLKDSEDSVEEEEEETPYNKDDSNDLPPLPPDDDDW